MYTFITGGYRSGRTNHALRKAAELGPPPWCYVSAGADEEDAIRKRIARHQRGEDAIWRIEAMPDDPRTLMAPETINQYGSLVLDGFAHWLEDWIASRPSDHDGDLLAEVEELSDLMYRASRPIVLVTREVGLARLPEREDERRIVRITTSANQILANYATSIVFMISGVAMRVR